MANWKRPKTWVCIIVAISCILFTVACGTNPQSVVNPPKAEIEVENNTVNSGTESVANGTTVSDKAETVDEVKNEPIMENKGQNTYGTGPLVDDVPRPERNVLFKTVKTPYDFFSRVTLDDINDYYMHAGSWGDDLYTDDTENIDRLLGIMDGINEDDIKKMTVVPDFHEYDSDNDAYFDLLCDDVSVSVIYRGGEIYLAFHAHAAELGLGLEKTNPNLYRTYKWQLESEALVELFEEYIEAFGGKDDPQLVDLTNESFTVDGEDLLKYKFRTDLQMIILEIEDPNGEFIGEFTISSEGGGGYIRFVEMNEDEEQVYEMSAFPKYEYRIFGEDLEGCTVTLSSKNRF